MPCGDARISGETGASGARECLQSLRGQEKREGFSYLPGAANLALPNRGAVASGWGFGVVIGIDFKRETVNEVAQKLREVADA